MRVLLFAVPLLILAGLVAVFAVSMNRNPSFVPSVFIGKPAPEFVATPIAGLEVPGFDTALLKGEVTVLNVFASWCIPCRDEHPLLTALAEQTGVRLFGLNQKDAPENATRFLAELGNPYDAIGADANGRISIDLGVYGVPETFLIDASGTVVLKIVGPLSQRALDEQLIPAIEKARGT